MSWDLAISSLGDVILTHNNDLAGKSGTDLLEQRMKIRLKLHRGSWGYDEDDSLGSQLYMLTGMTPDRAAALAQSYVRDALRDMDEIQVDTVRTYVDPSDNGALVLVIEYQVLDDFGGPNDEAARQLEVSISAGGSA